MDKLEPRRRDDHDVAARHRVRPGTTVVDSWNLAMKDQPVKKTAESQSIDLGLLASTPMYDRWTFERAQAVEEKMAERLRRSGGCAGKTYQDWMAEVDRQVAHHERRGERQPQSFSPSPSSPSATPKKRGRPPSFDRCVWGSLQLP